MYEGIGLMSNVQVKEDFSHHTIVVFGMLSAPSFPSTLIPNTPTFVPVTFDDISSVVNTPGDISDYCHFPQSSGTFPLCLFFSFVVVLYTFTE